MTRTTGKTNKVTVVKLASSIEQVVWSRAIAAPGGTVDLEIFTHLVGNGATIQIELSDASGKKHGVYKEQISGNRFWAGIQVPAKAEKALVATVKLPKHGLELTSPALLLMPAVEIKNLKWNQKEVRRGDVLKLTADVSGPPDGTEAQISIWEHDADSAHDLVTRMSVLVEGGEISAEWEFQFVDDTDDIPTEEEAERGYQHPEYFFRVDVGGVSDESEIIKFEDFLEINLATVDGEPIEGEEYVITLADGRTKKGKLDKQGRAFEKDIPPGSAKVVFPKLDDRDWTP